MKNILVYEYNELNEKAKIKALKCLEELQNDFLEPYLLVDDCFLLEPGAYDKNIKDLSIIGNNRKILFSLESNYLDISKAMIIDDDLFYKWLNLGSRLINKLDYYEILESSIAFHFKNDTNPTDKQTILINKAVEKFEKHCDNILEALQIEYEYRYSEEYLTGDFLENRECYFFESGILCQFNK